METLSDRIPKNRPEFVEIDGVKEFIRQLKIGFKSKNCQNREANPPYCNDCWNCRSINNFINKLAGDKLIDANVGEGVA